MRTTIIFGCLLCLTAAPLASLAAVTAEESEKPIKCDFRVKDAEALIISGKSILATESILEPAIRQLDDVRKREQRDLFCSRTGAETLAYLLKTASGENEKKSAVVIDYNFALAYYYLGYISVDRGDLKDAELRMGQALALSPSNPLFLCEMGHLIQLRKDWLNSLKLYEQAIEATAAFSPKEIQAKEKARGLRGKAYSLVELNRLDEAKESYLECLSIDPNDGKAKAEIKYIEGLEKKQKTN